MNLKERYDALVEEGWLISNTHPSLDLTIYNYSQKTQYEKYWTPETLAARGLVINSNGEIVARPFSKFFNASEVAMDLIPNEPFEVFEKMDGSLGIFFWYSAEDALHPVFASRGSFTSEQATKGWELLQKLPYRDLAYEHTHMFEIIYPENRIVIDYGAAEKLVLLGVIETVTGIEVDRQNIEEHLGNSFDIVKAYNINNSWVHLRAQNEPNREGYVIRFSNGFRVKIKFEEYVRLHRIITSISTTDIWEMLAANKPLDEILKEVPDEFFNWVRETEGKLQTEFETLENEYKCIYKMIMSANNTETRAVFANYAKRYKHPSLLFNMVDGKDYAPGIWKMIKPVWSKPFKNEDA